ncbi:MarR family winged helix-turn-helix transcriptional regulator [Priestia endophytica]|jgi:MarR family transcriptional regulator, organic hydroperoxide resistance regulator|uniref:MarR family winged helix-turn-helix transcriptional regulator n=1 Tax=Priestia endophytica TaxID=135735 RepID=UPI000DCA7EDB|nr:MarR family transcriptional regulator [Priestia endophytica]KAB2492730.1 MarR family transcriptional regulator [Priestia endophytica]RAS85047.1 MarR family transcriptional regulator [Priestia endophytica]RAS85779.1 MarR family transcriptional regulator [Priestia endophytica]
MDEMKQELLEEADWLFRKMVRKFIKERDKIIIEGVILSGFLILRKIIRDGEQRLTDLAEELDLTSGAITAICDKLEGRGFAVRKRHKEDRRIVLLDITDEGRKFLNRNGDIGVNMISVLFDGFSTKEIKLQIDAYQRLISNLENLSCEILTLAKENKNKKDSSIQKNRFLTY